VGVVRRGERLRGTAWWMRRRWRRVDVVEVGGLAVTVDVVDVGWLAVTVDVVKLATVGRVVDVVEAR
jgi:hypothetical protein